MHQECELSIITINYNGLKETCALIETIPFNDKMEVIVVDNASIHNEASEIQKRFPLVKIIKSDKNLGFAGGNNLGIKAAKGKYLFLVNNDTLFKNFNVQALIDRLESSKEIGITCPKIRFAWGNNPIQYAGYTPLSKITVRNQAIGFGEEDKGQYETPHATPYAHGAAMMIKREAIEKVGLMPECYFLYYEELDWSIMFARAGYKIWYEPQCIVYHKESRLLFVKRNYQNIYKGLSYIYLIGIAIPKDVVKYTFFGNIKLSISVLRGLYDFIFKKYFSTN